MTSSDDDDESTKLMFACSYSYKQSRASMLVIRCGQISILVHDKMRIKGSSWAVVPTVCYLSYECLIRN